MQLNYVRSLLDKLYNSFRVQSGQSLPGYRAVDRLTDGRLCTIKDQLMQLYSYKFYFDVEQTPPPKSMIKEWMATLHEILTYFFDYESMKHDDFAFLNDDFDEVAENFIPNINTKCYFMSGFIMEGKSMIGKRSDCPPETKYVNEPSHLYRSPFSLITSQTLKANCMLEFASTHPDIVESIFIFHFILKFLHLLYNRDARLTSKLVFDRFLLDHFSFASGHLKEEQIKWCFQVFIDNMPLESFLYVFRNLQNFDETYDLGVRWPILNIPERKFEYETYKTKEQLLQACFEYWQAYAKNWYFFGELLNIKGHFADIAPSKFIRVVRKLIHLPEYQAGPGREFFRLESWNSDVFNHPKAKKIEHVIMEGNNAKKFKSN